MPTIVKATSTCRTCAAAIGWVRTRAGTAVPVDPSPTGAGSAGRVAVHKDVHGSLVARVVTDEMPADPWETLYTPHHATCAPPTLFDPPPADNVIPLPTKRRNPRAYHTPDH